MTNAASSPSVKSTVSARSRGRVLDSDAVLRVAEDIVAKSGLRGLSVRGLAEGAGVSVGSIYNVAEGGLDGIIHAVNARTLWRLATCMEACWVASADKVHGKPAAVERAVNLSRTYFAFVRSNAHLWEAMLGHVLPDEWLETADYAEARQATLASVEPAVSPFFPVEAERRRAVVALWAALQGVAALEAAGKLAGGFPAEEIGELLVRRFLHDE